MQLAGIGIITIETSMIIIVLLLVRKLMGEHINPIILKTLWASVMLRILMPVHITVDVICIGDLLCSVFGTIKLQSLIVSIWIIGICLIGAFFVIKNIVFSYVLKRNSELYGKKDGILVYFVEHKIGSCLVGVLFPKIYISKLADGSIDWCNWIVKHELCHYRAKDNWYNFLRSVCVVLQWFNPLVWYAAKCSIEDFEMACDYNVICNEEINEQITYGKCLLAMSAQNKKIYDINSVASYSKGSLKRRLHAIGHDNKYYKSLGVLSILLMVSITVFCFVGKLDGEETMLYQLAHTSHFEEKIYCYELEYSGEENIETVLYGVEQRIQDTDKNIKAMKLEDSMIVIIFPLFDKSGSMSNDELAEYVANGFYLSYVSENTKFYINNVDDRLIWESNAPNLYSLWVYLPETDINNGDYIIYKNNEPLFLGTEDDRKNDYICIGRYETFDEMYDCRELLISGNSSDLVRR